MKQLMTFLLALTFSTALNAFAQQNSNMSQAQADQSAAQSSLTTLKGTVKIEGEKCFFVSDKDGKTWNIINPEEVKGDEGQHVRLSAQVYADKDSIHVISVKALKSTEE
jgi:hypothetical protein